MKESAAAPEVFLSTSLSSARVSRQARSGTLRKIGPRLYTPNLVDAPETIVRRNLWQVLGLLFPGAVVSYRTALEGKPTPEGDVFLAGAYRRTVKLPGITVHILPGSGPLDGDQPFIEALFIASRGRAMLDALRPGRGAAGRRRLDAAALEAWLDRLIRTAGEDAANLLREEVRTVAPLLDAKAERKRFERTLGILLGSRTGRTRTPEGAARVRGEPYDAVRLARLGHLYAALVTHPSESRADAGTASPEFTNLAFFDAYFSNFIEGTEFRVDEAREIVFEGKIPARRPADAHDILGTFRVVGSAAEMRSVQQLCDDFDAFVELLQRRHALVMAGRPERGPGHFKTEVNVVGSTVFVAPELVRGTLRKGWEMHRSLSDPFARAAFLLFLITEVHPFEDGNGRVARAFMNAELVAASERRILVPTSYRYDYLAGLRRLSRSDDPSVLIRMLDRAQVFSAAVDFRDYAGAERTLRRCNAFEEEEGARLRLP